MRNEIIYREKQLDRYYNSVKKALVCNKRVKDEIVIRLKCSVEDYIDDNPHCTYGDIESHFGTPESIAALNADASGIDYDSRIRANQALKIVSLTITALILLSFAISHIAITYAENAPEFEVTGQNI